MWAIWLVIGILMGMVLGRLIFRDKPIGTIRIMDVDDEDTYMFLEIDEGRIDNFRKKRTVNVRVR